MPRNENIHQIEQMQIVRQHVDDRPAHRHEMFYRHGLVCAIPHHVSTRTKHIFVQIKLSQLSEFVLST